MAKNIPVYQVEDDVPIPVKISTPLERLAVGESFSFPLDKRRSIQTQASALKKRDDKEFTVRKVDDEVARVWRTK